MSYTIYEHVRASLEMRRQKMKSLKELQGCIFNRMYCLSPPFISSPP